MRTSIIVGMETADLAGDPGSQRSTRLRTTDHRLPPNPLNVALRCRSMVFAFYKRSITTVALSVIAGLVAILDLQT
jgi:hypothetical protein